MTTSSEPPDDRCGDCGEIIKHDADPECPHDGQPECPYCGELLECDHILSSTNPEESVWDVSPFEEDMNDYWYHYVELEDYVSPLPMSMNSSGWSEAHKREALADLAPVLDQWPTDTESLFCYEEQAFEVILPYLRATIKPVRGYSSWCGYDWMVTYSPQPKEARAEIAEIVAQLHQGFSRLAAMEPETA